MNSSNTYHQYQQYQQQALMGGLAAASPYGTTGYPVNQHHHHQMAAAAAAAYMYGGGSSAAYSGSTVGSGGGAALVKEEHHSPVGGSETSPGVAHRAAALGPYGSHGSSSETPVGSTDVRDMLGMYLHGTTPSTVGNGSGDGSSPTLMHGGLREGGSPSLSAAATSRLMTQVNYDGFFRHHQHQSQLQQQQQHMLGQSSSSPGMINNTMPLSHI